MRIYYLLWFYITLIGFTSEYLTAATDNSSSTPVIPDANVVGDPESKPANGAVDLHRMLREQQTQIETMKQQISRLQQEQTTSANAPTWSASSPIQISSGNSYVNLSFDGLFAAGASTADDIEGGTQLGGHDPKQRGFTVQNLEITLDGNVDPYVRGQANLVLNINPDGETVVEAEEAYLETLALPRNLQVKAGQFFTEFGRLNPSHPHTWDFADQPLVNGRFFGEDGLRGPGARVSWLAPTSFYSELFFTVQNSQGETAHSFRSDHEGEGYLGRIHDQGRVKTITDMLFSARYAASFDLTDNQTLLTGASSSFGPNGSGSRADTQIYGLDAFWKWKSPRAHAGFPFVSLQTEAMLRRMDLAAFSEDLDASGTLDAGEPDLNGDGVIQSVPNEMITDWGCYAQLLYGFRRGWVAGLRGEYVGRENRANYEKVYGDDTDRADRWRLSPNLTHYPSEFSKIRLQYNLDDRQDLGVDHSVWVQFEFLLGSHSAHKF